MQSIELKEFQIEAVNKLLDATSVGKKKEVLVQAPTGSGKTIILLSYIEEYLKENRKTIFVWLTPGSGDLEEQSRSKMLKFLPHMESKNIQDVLLQGFEAKDTAFINWETITKKGNTALKEAERKNLYERVREAYNNGYEFVVIVDEEHLNKTVKAEAIIDFIDPKYIVRVSATTKTNKEAEYIEIDELDVINAGLITRALYINENVTNEKVLTNEHDYLLDLAINKRKAIKEEYLNRNIQVNPLIIIQLPNKSDELVKQIEDLCTVRDASCQRETYVNGYHVCEVVGLSKNKKQPISLYSKIYSTESKGFLSCNDETKKSEKYVVDKIRKVKPNAKIIDVKDRGYDAFELFKDTLDNGIFFVVRMDGNRKMLFKGKQRLVSEVAASRKGKIHTKLMYKGENIDCYISYTRVQFPKLKEKDLTLVIIYRTDEESDPMYLLTDMDIKSKDDAEKIARIYMLRWRIEEYFRAKKQNYDFENFRVRTLQSINNLNLLLSCVMLHLGILSDAMDKKLLTIKILEESKSLKNKVIVWFGQLSKGIINILKNARTGIKAFQEIESREKYKQLSLQI